MALTASSTYAQVKAQYEDNADYDVTGDVTAAKDFIIACRFLLGRMAEEMTKGGATVKENYKRIETELKEAKAWWKSNDPNAVNAGANEQVRYVDFTNFRQ